VLTVLLLEALALQQIRINFEYLRPLISKHAAQKSGKIDLFWFKPTSGILKT
jgi:hypothetical protein